MRELPHAYELLEYAREVLRKEVLAALPADQRLNGLMIANAMGIAARQLRGGDYEQYRELVRLQQLLQQLGIQTDQSIAVDQPQLEMDSQQLQHQLNALHRQLGKAIRHGALNGQDQTVFEFLQQSIALKVAESSGTKTA